VTEGLLNASSSTLGTFTYSVTAGSNLPAGVQVVTAKFDPTDTTNFKSVTVEKTLTVTGSTAAVTSMSMVIKGKITSATVMSAKDKTSIKKATVVTVMSYVAKGASKSADLTASRTKAAKAVALLKKSAPNATYVIKAMGSTLNASCTAQKNECVLIVLG
jgi:hypothetical protein